MKKITIRYYLFFYYCYCSIFCNYGKESRSGQRTHGSKEEIGILTTLSSQNTTDSIKTQWKIEPLHIENTIDKNADFTPA